MTTQENYVPEAIKKQIDYCDAYDRQEHSCVLCHKPVSVNSIEEHDGCHHCGADIEIRIPWMGNDFCVLKKPLVN